MKKDLEKLIELISRECELWIDDPEPYTCIDDQNWRSGKQDLAIDILTLISNNYETI